MSSALELSRSETRNEQHTDDPATAGYDRAAKIARELAELFAGTAIERDKRGGTAKAERDALRGSGLLTLSIPLQYGGWGLNWHDTLRVVRIISSADSSVGHLFGFQHLLLATLRFFGRQDQWQPLFEATVQQRWFWGNALNPLDQRTFITQDGADWRISGEKSFCSGAKDSDMLVVSALRKADERLVVAAVPSHREGIEIRADWDNMGQRQTDSGSSLFSAVQVLDREILRDPGPLGSVFASLRSCLAQLILVNIYLGIAQGAHAAGRAYTRTQARPWFAANVASATQDPYVLAQYGEFHAGLQAAELVSDHAAKLFDAAWARGDALTAEERGECSLAVATAKVISTRIGLDITQRIFEVAGARATSSKAGLDRFWRNLRTHTLHDPLSYKLRDLGEWSLNGTAPTPSFYS